MLKRKGVQKGRKKKKTKEEQKGQRQTGKKYDLQRKKKRKIEQICRKASLLITFGF